MTGLVFLLPPWWPAVLLVPVLLWTGQALAAAAARRRRRVLGPREAALCGRAAGGFSRAVCAIGAGAGAAAALLQPVWGEAAGEPVGPDVVVCLDVSLSMAARDTPPTRLMAAQQELGLLAAQGGMRLGLVVFAGDARLVAPLTFDLASVATLAAGLAAGGTGRGGSDLGAAIESGLGALQRGQAHAASLVVLSDGEDFGGRGSAKAAAALAAGVPVHCIGFGREGGSKIVVEGEGGEAFLRDGAGEEVVTKLEAGTLAAVAQAGGGRFLRHDGPGTLSSLCDEVLRPAAAIAAVRDARAAPAHRFQWPLLAAVLLWMLRWCLPERRR